MSNLDEIRNLLPVYRMIIGKEWQEGYWPLIRFQREAIIDSLKKAKLAGKAQEHGFEYYQGLLAGYDVFATVSENIKRKYELAMEEADAEEKERRENTNEEHG